jgi:ectoine hydroxylase-related dioxygenase (phytanoyl-CoA dioxygenase family)
MSFHLTDQQKSFFDTFGYLAFPGLLRDRAAAISREFDAVFAARGGGHHGKVHDGKARSCIVPFMAQSEYLCSLLDDSRIHGIATSLLGDDFNYMGSDGNYYVGDTNWHSDGWHPGDRLFIKIALYLDPLTRDTGSLRVIPGSHKIEDHYAQALQNNRCDTAWGVAGKDVPAVALETLPGDVVLFNHNTKHAAFGGGQWRRMFTINLSTRFPPERVQELRDYIAHYARFWCERTYRDTMVQTAGPQRMRHLEQLLANQDHLPALAKKARESMAEPSRG